LLKQVVWVTIVQ